ncbi:GNAT family N-acetyltransferase [Vallitalea okinawensis]|uniref:GNAT family N-acetyltransferase n=1 Tax=Vallitalea okinawensis TaxID=2078660 RepID=UPI001A9A584D|nr:GNAT family N-acetyltransferase [Vallitalea okinawensis]
MISYINSIESVSTKNIKGFFVNWPNPPSTEKHYEVLKNSSYIWLALDNETNDIVGFVTAISDNVLSAYIPLLEVLPEYQGKGIGTQLVKLMLETLEDFYMVDLLCDEDLTEFYSKFGMLKSRGMVIRNYDKQCGR